MILKIFSTGLRVFLCIDLLDVPVPMPLPLPAFPFLFSGKYKRKGGQGQGHGHVSQLCKMFIQTRDSLLHILPHYPAHKPS